MCAFSYANVQPPLASISPAVLRLAPRSADAKHGAMGGNRGGKRRGGKGGWGGKDKPPWLAEAWAGLSV